MANKDYYVVGCSSARQYEDLRELDRLTALAGKKGRRLEDKSRELIKLSEEVLEITESEISGFFSSYQKT
ncbi:MAG: hypothetical protein ACOC1P_03165 [Minisyncoccales bacterium]